MKNILFAVTTAFCVTVGADLAAQTKTNTLTSQQASDSTATEVTDPETVAATGQAPADSVPTAQISEKPAVVKNIAMSRPNKLKRGINGYYIMDGNRDRGTNGSMNHYEPRYTNNGALNAPIYETGVEEPADSTATETSPAAQPADDGWDEESPATKDSSKESSKKSKAKTEEVPW
jgi:hypothetical protein